MIFTFFAPSSPLYPITGEGREGRERKKAAQFGVPQWEHWTGEYHSWTTKTEHKLQRNRTIKGIHTKQKITFKNKDGGDIWIKCFHSPSETGVRKSFSGPSCYIHGSSPLFDCNTRHWKNSIHTCSTSNTCYLLLGISSLNRKTSSTAQAKQGFHKDKCSLIQWYITSL